MSDTAWIVLSFAFTFLMATLYSILGVLRELLRESNGLRTQLCTLTAEDQSAWLYRRLTQICEDVGTLRHRILGPATGDDRLTPPKYGYFPSLSLDLHWLRWYLVDRPMEPERQALRERFQWLAEQHPPQET